jgi:hypothetical protein
MIPDAEGQWRQHSEVVQIEADLNAKLAVTDAARRHAQAVSSLLVDQVRMLKALIERPTGILDKLLAGWPGEAIPVVKDPLTTEIATPSETIATVTAWANETFGQATILAMVKRSRDEFNELLDLIGDCAPDKIAEEAADVCICLYRVIGTLDPEAINKKMAKNRARKWNVDGQGCAQHVGE